MTDQNSQSISRRDEIFNELKKQRDSKIDNFQSNDIDKEILKLKGDIKLIQDKISELEKSRQSLHLIHLLQKTQEYVNSLGIPHNEPYTVITPLGYIWKSKNASSSNGGFEEYYGLWKPDKSQPGLYLDRLIECRSSYHSSNYYYNGNHLYCDDRE